MKRPIFALVAILLTPLATAPTRAAVNVERHGAENPMVEISRSILYGGLAGLAIGGAIAIADEDSDNTDPLKYGLVAGVFAGAAVGFYWVMSRPQPSAALELDSESLALRLPTPVLTRDGGTRVSLVAYRF